MVDLTLRPVSCPPFTNAPCSPAGALLLAKFQVLDAYNKELQAENIHLKDRLTSSPARENGVTSTPRVDERVSEGTLERVYSGSDMRTSTGSSDMFEDCLDFDSFSQHLTTLGISVSTKAVAKQALEELFFQRQQQEVQISKKGVHLLQQFSCARVYFLAKIAGTEHGLTEHDRFDLRSGRQKTLMVPLEVRLRTGEDWREAARRGFQSMVGLQPEWQDNYIVFDESSYTCTTQTECDDEENPLNSLFSVTVHEVHARLKAFEIDAPDGDVLNEKVMEVAYEQIGLPSGRDFVYCGESRTTVHIWCWKSRELERNSRLKTFESYLQERSVDMSLFGTLGNKTLFQVYQEILEHKRSTLEEDKDGNLVRVVQMLHIKLIAEVNKRKVVLSEAEQPGAEGDLQFAPQDTLQVANTLTPKQNAGWGKRASRQEKIEEKSSAKHIGRRLLEGEDWREAITVELSDLLGIDAEIQAECCSVDDNKMRCTKEHVELQGFSSIPSTNMIRTVTVYVTNPAHGKLDCIGLPRGNDFVSQAPSSLGGEPTLRVWTWAVAMDEDNTAGNFAGTALERLNRDLSDVEHILTQTVNDGKLVSLGLEQPFKTSLGKIKQCVERMANIDETCKTVDIKSVMAQGSQATRKMSGGQGDSAGMASFIEANFVRAAQPQGPKKFSSGQALSTAKLDHDQDQDLENFRLEQIFDNAPQLLKTMAAGRHEWEFDFFDMAGKFDSATMMLEAYGEVMLVPFCVHSLGCTEEAAQSFVQIASSLYDDNPYHGPIHAAQVCHLARWLTKAMNVMQVQEPMESTAFMLAAFCHDIKHIGRNNNFCMQSEHPLARLYNNSSVLENFHASSCLELLESNQVLKQLARTERSVVRSHIIENILATDMAEHFETISKYRVRREAQDFSIETEADRRFVARLCLKSGDLGHACLPWNLHVEWASRVTLEFYAQGDEEKSLGLPMSALCDRKDVDNIAKSQKGFLGFVVSPLYRALAESQPQVLTREVNLGNNSEATLAVKQALSSRGRSLSTMMDHHFVDAFRIDDRCLVLLAKNTELWAEDTKTVTATVRRLRKAADNDSDDDAFGEDDDGDTEGTMTQAPSAPITASSAGSRYTSVDTSDASSAAAP